MPMSEEDRAFVLASIERIFREDIHDEFADYFAAASALAERIPDQVNNEIRNATTHLSRAVCADDVEVAKAEIALGRAHIERGKRDALKLAIAEIEDRLKRALLELDFRRGHLDAELIVERKTLSKDYSQLKKDEAHGKPDVTQGMAKLYLEAFAFYERVAVILKVEPPHRQRFRAIRIMVVKAGLTGRQMLIWLIGAVLAGLIGGFAAIAVTVLYEVPVTGWIKDNFVRAAPQPGAMTTPAPAAADSERTP